MIYNLQNEYDIPKFEERVKTLLDKGSVVELKERKPKRSLRQNSYLHLIIGFFAAKYGCTADEAKVRFYKGLANKRIFSIKRNGNEVFRSTKELTTEELSLSIDRFRNWSAAQANIYLPSADEREMLVYVEQYIEQHKQYI